MLGNACHVRCLRKKSEFKLNFWGGQIKLSLNFLKVNDYKKFSRQISVKGISLRKCQQTTIILSYQRFFKFVLEPGQIILIARAINSLTKKSFYAIL